MDRRQFIRKGASDLSKLVLGSSLMTLVGCDPKSERQGDSYSKEINDRVIARIITSGSGSESLVGIRVG